jgi:flagellar basal-body rod protein FlgB
MTTASLPDLPSLLEMKMAYDAQRHRQLTENVAGLDIPGYKARDLAPLDFHAMAMGKAGGQAGGQASQLPMRVTSSRHMAGMGGQSSPAFRTETVKNTYEQTPDGSNSVLEEQMMHLSENSHDYQMIVNLYKKVGSLVKEALGSSSSS